MRRVRYEADGGRAALLGLSMDLFRLFCAAVVLMGLVTPAELRFLLPDLEEGLYAHGAPFARHRPHNGLALLHLTLAMRQLSQDSLSLGALGGVTGRSDWSGMVGRGVGGCSERKGCCLENSLESRSTEWLLVWDMIYRARAPCSAERES